MAQHVQNIKLLLKYGLFLEIWPFKTRGLNPSKYMTKKLQSRLCWLFLVSRDFTGKLGKFEQFKIKDFCLCQSRFYVPDISDSSRNVPIFVQVVYVPATGRLVG